MNFGAASARLQPMTPEEMTLRRMRQVAFALLSVALLVELADRLVLGVKLRAHNAEKRYLQRMQPKGVTVAELGRSLLEVTSPRG